MDGGVRQFLPVSAPELLRTQAMLERVVGSFRFAQGRFVLLISFLEDGGYAIPFERALMALGLLVTNADNSPYEALRIESICRRFDVAAVAGVTADVLDGLDTAGYAPETIFGGRVVWAFPSAYERLAGIPGITLRRLLELGPAFALECREGAGAHVDGQEWDCRADHGEIVLTSRLLRATGFQDHPTLVRGHVLTGPCGCGSVDVRVRLDE